MKILIVSPYAPFPPHAGGRIRIFEEINILSKKHEVAVTYFVYTKRELKESLGLKQYCAKILPILYTNFMSIADVIPQMVQEYIASEMISAISKLKNEFNPDIALIQHIYMSYYRSSLPKLTILEEHNIESKVLERSSQLIEENFPKQFVRTNAARVFKDSEKQARLLFDYENKNWQYYPLRITVSALDKHEMDSRCTTGESIVIENGVNISSRQLLSENFPLPRNIIFFGTLDYYPNLDGLFWFLTDILPVIWSYDQNIQFTITGRNPPNGLKQLCQDTRIKIIPNPVDIRPIAENCSISIVPLRVGGGTRLKILDAMSLGLPVVSTSLGCEGLSVSDQENILIRDDAKLFASAVISLLNDQNSFSRIRTNARKLVEKFYTWETVYDKLEPKINEHLQLIQSQAITKR